MGLAKVQARQDHWREKEAEVDDEEAIEGEEGKRQIWQADFWEGGFRKVHLEQDQEAIPVAAALLGGRGERSDR